MARWMRTACSTCGTGSRVGGEVLSPPPHRPPALCLVRLRPFMLDALRHALDAAAVKRHFGWSFTRLGAARRTSRPHRLSSVGSPARSSAVAHKVQLDRMFQEIKFFK